jgi:Predicted ATPase (AAA+ superfamily)
MIQRKKFLEIQPYLATDDVIVIHGARQTGKTTLLNLIADALPRQSVHYLDLEDGRYLALCEEGPESINTYLSQKGLLTGKEKFYLQIDEIQYLSNPSNMLKLMHDHFPLIKLIVSGSSSFDIKRKFKDSLVGRTVDFELFPLDFEEFLNFKGLNINLDRPIKAGPVRDELTILYREFVKYGGYPKIALTDSIEMKEKYLQQIVDTYVKNDIRDLANVKHIAKFNKLLRLLAAQSGNLLNVAELSRTARIAQQTVEEYLFILESTYIIKLVQPFSGNIRSELFKTPKIFFYDTGIMHMLSMGMLPKEISGAGFETSIFSELAKLHGPKNVFHWRTQDKKEIDFILSKGGKLFPIEAKINAAAFNDTAMNCFSQKYNAPQQLCVSLEGVLPQKSSPVINVRPWDIALRKPKFV